MKHCSCVLNRLHVMVLVFFLMFGALAADDDISIKQAGNIGGYPAGVCVKDGYGFLAQGTALSVLDVSADEITKVTSLILPDEPSSWKIQGNYIFSLAGNSDSAFQVIDVSDPKNPELCTLLPISAGWLSKLHLAGNYAYLALRDRFTILDISNPESPVVMSTIEQEVMDIFVNGERACVINRNEFTIYDVTDPQNPVEKGSTEIDNGVAIVCQGDYAYVGCDRYPKIGVQVINISDANNPVKGHFEETKIVEGSSTAFKSPTAVAIADSHLYISCIARFSWLFIADISDLQTPTLTGQMRLDIIGQYPKINSMQIVPPYAYVTTSTASDGFVIVNIEDDENPHIENIYEAPWDVMYICSAGEKLYVSSVERLWVYSFEGLGKPALLNSDTTWANFYRMVIEDGYLYGIREGKIYLLDVSDPMNIYQVGEYSSPLGELRELKVHQKQIYALTHPDNRNTLEIIDATNPALPTQVSAFDIAGIGRDLFVDGPNNMVLVAYTNNSPDQGFQIVDITDPASPVSMSETATSGKPIAIWKADSLAYIGSNTITQSDSTYFIESFNVSDATQPVAFKQFSESGIIADLEVHDGLVLASIPGGSIHLYDAIILNYFMKCPSPHSLYLAVIWSLMRNSYFVFTMDGYFCPEYLAASASWGIFIQKLTTEPKKVSLAITPSDTTVGKGDKVQFKSVSFDSTGNSYSSTPVWTATGGEMDSLTGTYTATDEGTFTITANDSATGLHSSTTIHVTSTSVEQHLHQPLEFSLSQNYPNPFNPSTTIPFTVKEKCDVELKIYDIQGREVATLIHAEFDPGHYQAEFNAGSYATGIYLYKIKMNNFEATKKMIFVE